MMRLLCKMLGVCAFAVVFYCVLSQLSNIIAINIKELIIAQGFSMLNIALMFIAVDCITFGVDVFVSIFVGLIVTKNFIGIKGGNEN